MYCTNCGKELPDNSTFCPNCGQSFREKSHQQEEAIKQRKPNNMQTSPLQVSDILEGKAIVSLVAGIVGLCTSPIILGLVAWIAGRKALKDNPRNPLAKAGRVLGIIGFVIGLISAFIMGSLGVAVWDTFTLY